MTFATGRRPAPGWTDSGPVPSEGVGAGRPRRTVWLVT